VTERILLFYMCQLWALHVVIKRQFLKTFTELSLMQCLLNIRNNAKHLASLVCSCWLYRHVQTVLLIRCQEVCCSLGDIGRPGLEFPQEPALPVLPDWPK